MSPHVQTVLTSLMSKLVKSGYFNQGWAFGPGNPEPDRDSQNAHQLVQITKFKFEIMFNGYSTRKEIMGLKIFENYLNFYF